MTELASGNTMVHIAYEHVRRDLCVVQSGLVEKRLFSSEMGILVRTEAQLVHIQDRRFWPTET